MRYLLDTNVCVALMRGRARVRERMARVQPEDCAVSMISAFELFHGLERCAQPETETPKIELLLGTVHLLPFEREAARRAAEVRHRLEQAGMIIGPFDVLIAGHALAAGLVLVTHNTSEFLRVDGLTVEDWEV